MTENDIKEVLLQLNLVNSQYCDMYDEFFSQKVGSAYDYNAALSQLFRIQCLLENCNANLTLFKNASPDEPAILASIQTYIENREQSMKGFRSVLHGLQKRANGKLFQYSFVKYRKEVSALEKLESDAIIIGDVLQNYYDQRYSS